MKICAKYGIFPCFYLFDIMIVFNFESWKYVLYKKKAWYSLFLKGVKSVFWSENEHLIWGAKTIVEDWMRVSITLKYMIYSY